MSETDALAQFFSYEMIVTSLAIMALLTLVKRMGRQFKPFGRLQRKEWFKAFIMTPMNLILGVVAAYIPNWLTTPDQQGKLLIGLTAGFISQFTYTIFKKRLSLIASSDDEETK